MNIKELPIADKKAKAKEIIKHVNKYFKVKCESVGRPTEIVLPRQMAMYYIKQNINLSNRIIGELFPSKKSVSGYLDSSTVYHACTTIASHVKYDPEIKDWHKDLDKACKTIAIFSEKDIKKYLTIEDISNRLKLLDENKVEKILKEVNKFV